jgi:peptidoglycan/LPS O-acetylase OafA/YrhL
MNRFSIPSAPFEVDSERRWEGLDLLRGAAALMVFLFHYFGMTGLQTKGNLAWESFESFALMLGSLGTNLLLMLSGFLISKSLSRPSFSYWEFLKRRSLRVFVPYTAIVGLTGVFLLVFPVFAKDHEGQSLASYYLQQLLLWPGLFPSRPLLTVSWTLSYIFAGYCIVPLLAMAWGRAAGYLKLWILVLTLCLVSNVVSGLPMIRICYIPAGCILAELVMSNRAALTSAWSLGRTLVLGMAFLGLRFGLESGSGETQRVLYFLCGLGAASSFAILSIYWSQIVHVDFQALPLRLLNFIGRRGYSFYLLHGAVTKLFVLVCVATTPWVFSSWISSTLLLITCLTVSSVVSEISFQLLECPRWNLSSSLRELPVGK